jgi:ABC-type antimicrobial peptide transport system permease subunit
MNVNDSPLRPRVDQLQASREATVGALLGKVVAAAAILGFVGALLGDGVGDVLAAIAVAMVVALPILRVTWLIAVWKKQRDTRFVLLGCGLIVLIVIGVIVALLRR